jgi:hypothetical protein
MIEVPAEVLDRFRGWSLYNSPYDAHDCGAAIDCYPVADRAHSPVAGRVLETRTVRAPSRPYAPEHDHLILIDTADAPPDASASHTTDGAPAVARILHVDPAVEPSQIVSVGESLGTLVRAGFFAPWVDNHLHLEFRHRESNLIRASGASPLTAGVDPAPVSWDGRGTVVETGETYALLDRPTHPAPGDRFAGIATDDGAAILDGGLPHYDGGGRLSTPEDEPSSSESIVSLLDTSVGRARGRTVDWHDLSVSVDDCDITGLSLFPARESLGAKLICPDRSLEVGQSVHVRIDRDQ